MEHDLAALRGSGDDSGIAQVTLDQLDGVDDRLKPGPVARAEVVEDCHVIATIQQRPHQVVPDEPGTAGDQYSHVQDSSLIGPEGLDAPSAAAIASHVSPEIWNEVVELMNADWIR